MAHDRLSFEMPAPPEVVFDAFHYHEWRLRWDSLVRETQVEGGGRCPRVGALTSSRGRGLLGGLVMRTRFVTYEPGRLAAAAMEGEAFPFRRWAASMRHEALEGGRSLLVYTYTFEVGPQAFAWLLSAPTRWMFARQTHRRFQRLQRYLDKHAGEIAAWQARGRP